MTYTALTLWAALKAAGYPCKVQRCIRVNGVWYVETRYRGTQQ
jgi:hypothetical protein